MDADVVLKEGETIVIVSKSEKQKQWLRVWNEEGRLRSQLLLP